MLKLLSLLVAIVAGSAPALVAQVPGAYPHLVLTDGQGTSVPGAGGPFDNSGVFPAFSGQSFSAQMTYQSAGQPNTNVLWGLLVSTAKTPLPTNVTPPPLLTLPPFLLIVASPPNLNGNGFGEVPLFVPAGVYSAQTYVQGILFDSTSVPTTRLSNGLTVTVQVPAFSANIQFAKSKPEGGDGQMRDLGTIDIAPEEFETLKPIGTQAPPLAIPDPAPLADDFRFLPILANLGDEPVNPLARPITRVQGSVTAIATTIPVADTTHFPSSGRIMVAFGSSNLFAAKSNQLPPAVEVVSYDGTTPTSFLNCKRAQLGSRGSTVAVGFLHVNDEMVLGYFTMATTVDAKRRTRVSLDADNRDMPHVVIPPFTFDAGGDIGVVTRDIDVYMYETLAEKVQGFMLLDRVTGTWRAIPGTEKNVSQGRWNPMVSIAPDGRSMIAHLEIPGGLFGWNNLADGVVAIRLDGLNWPASGSQTWMIPYQTDPDPINIQVTNVRSRRVWMPATAIVGANPDNYVAFIGLAHKWQGSSPTAGAATVDAFGSEAEWVSEEVIVRDYIDCPLTPPGSLKSLPSLPRLYITGEFGTTGQGPQQKQIIRFDPYVQRVNNDTQLMLTGGSTDLKEEAFLLRNISVAQNGKSNRLLINMSGYKQEQQTGLETFIRAFAPGGHGNGRRVAVSPDGQRVAWLLRDRTGGANLAQRKDWLQIGLTNGGSFGEVEHIYADAVNDDAFKFTGVLNEERSICGLRFIDNTRIVFMMGRNRYDDPFGLVTPALPVPQMDLFVYDITADEMTNLTRTGDPAGTGFAALGKINPAAYFASPNGEFSYFIRAGDITANQFSTNPANILPLPNKVANIIGLNEATLDLFPVTGTEIDGSALVANLTLAPADVLAPMETVAAMRFAAGSGVQDGLVYFAAHRALGNGGDDVFGLDRDSPFVTFAATTTNKPGAHVSNISPDPYAGRLAFARTGTADAYSANQHPYVVDLDNFLFERDLLPSYVSGGIPIGRVMDGSFHFIPPAGSAGDALVFSFGLLSLPGGIAGIATPAFYPLSAVSDLVAEPIPVLIPLVDTELLGTDYRFYIPAAGPSKQ